MPLYGVSGNVNWYTCIIMYNNFKCVPIDLAILHPGISFKKINEYVNKHICYKQCP